MVARINIRESISKALNYNEAKVGAGVGEIILASGFGCEVADLSFYDKLRRFEQLNQRNEWIKSNTLHISLNFPPGENLPADVLQRLAIDYMDRIGFGAQPFLVYEHHDAHHPHIHIVTTCIQPDGHPINLHNIGRDLSEPAREALEKEFGLIRARGREHHLDNPTEPPDLAAKVQEVTSSYKFTSLDELIAILAQFSMTAWPGAPGSTIRTNRGLIYTRIDADGNRIGTPVKSSDLATRPTLGWLEKRFLINKVKKQACRDRVADAFNAVIGAKNEGLMNILRRLEQRKMFLHAEADQNGDLTSLKIIDNRNKVVFTPEDLGLETNTVLAKLALPKIPPQQLELNGQNTGSPINTNLRKTDPPHTNRPDSSSTSTAIAAHVAWAILRTHTGTPGAAGEEMPKKKKRKKRSL